MVISVLQTGSCCNQDEPDPRVEMTLFEYLTAGNGQWITIDRDGISRVLYTFRSDTTYDEYHYAGNMELTNKKFEIGGPHSIERGTYPGGNACLAEFLLFHRWEVLHSRRLVVGRC